MLLFYAYIMLEAVYFGPFGGMTKVKFPVLMARLNSVMASSEGGPGKNHIKHIYLYADLINN